MKLVLYCPMRPHGLGHRFGRQFTRRDVIAQFKITGFATDLAQRGYHSDGFALGPFLPVDGDLSGRSRPGQLGHHTTVAGIQTLEARHVGTVSRNEGGTDFFQQGGLVALDHQQIVTALVDDLPGDILLAAHGIDADLKAFHVQGFEQFRNGGYFVALRLNALLIKDNAQTGRERTDDVRRPTGPIGRTANRDSPSG